MASRFEDGSRLALPTQQEESLTPARHDPLHQRLAIADGARPDREDLVRVVDANDHETLQVFDGINRLLRTIRDVSGDGANPNAIPPTPGESASAVTPNRQSWGKKAISAGTPTRTTGSLG